MRTRQRRVTFVANPGWSSVTGNWTNVRCSDAAITYQASGALTRAPFSQDYLDERIEDDDGPRLPLRTKWVWHRKRRVLLNLNTSLNTMATYQSDGVLSSNRFNSTLAGAAGNVNSLYWALNEDNAYNTWPLNASAVNRNALPYMLQGSSYSKSDQTLINDCHQKASQLIADVLLNICEADQFMPSVKSLTADLYGMQERWIRASNTIAKLRLAGKTVSAAYLAWQFGLGPIIKDLRSTISSAKVIQRKLQAFRDGKTLRYTAVATAHHTIDPLFANVGTPMGNSGVIVVNTKRFVHELVKPTRRVVLRVEPNRSAVDGALRDLQFFINRFATSPASLAWELTPWSFVLDWFVDLRGVLRGLDRMLGFAPYIVKSASISTSYRTRIETLRVHNSACSGSIMCSGWLSSCEYSHYERSPISDGFLPAWRNRFGKNQAAISAALITQYLTGSKR